VRAGALTPHDRAPPILLQTPRISAIAAIPSSVRLD
jgi:hypothetical protein